MQQQQRRFPPLQCHYCKKIGHKQVDCFYFFKDSKRNQGFTNTFGGHGQQQHQQHQQQQQLQPPGLLMSGFNSGMTLGHKRSRNERDDGGRFQQERFDQPQPQQQQLQSHYQESSLQQNECKESCCYRPESPNFVQVDDFTEALRYMAKMRDELGREKFKEFEPETFLGKKVHKALVNVENEL